MNRPDLEATIIEVMHQLHANDGHVHDEKGQEFSHDERHYLGSVAVAIIKGQQHWDPSRSSFKQYAKYLAVQAMKYQDFEEQEGAAYKPNNKVKNLSVYRPQEDEDEDSGEGQSDLWRNIAWWQQQEIDQQAKELLDFLRADERRALEIRYLERPVAPQREIAKELGLRNPKEASLLLFEAEGKVRKAYRRAPSISKPSVGSFGAHFRLYWLDNIGKMMLVKDRHGKNVQTRVTLKRSEYYEEVEDVPLPVPQACP